MNIFTRIGNWVESHFPEKMTPDQVATLVKAQNEHIFTRINSLERLHEDIKKIHEEINTLKTQSIMKSRVSNSNPSAMTPFASKFQPIGGNASPR